jgi:GT2 family glycosyltransferase
MDRHKQVPPSPRVSIVILNHDGLALNRKTFLESIRCALNSDVEDKEVILVDNNSNDGSVAVVREMFPETLKIISLKENRGHAGGMNRGSKEGHPNAGYLVFVNNDVLYGRHVIRIILEFMEKNPLVAACGCLEEIPGRPKNFCGSNYDSKLYNVEPNCGKEPCPVTTVENFMVVRKEPFDRLGGFDELLYNVFDEQEFCLRLWMCGYTVVCLPSVSFVHNHVLPIKENPSRWALDLRNKYIAMVKLYSSRGIISQLGARVIKDLYKSLRDENWRKSGMSLRIIKSLLDLIMHADLIVKGRRGLLLLKRYDENDLAGRGVIKQ